MLNKHFGYGLTPPEFTADDSPWDEHHVRRHFEYLEVYRNDEYVRHEVTKQEGRNLKKLNNKGYIGPMLEFGGHVQPEQQTPPPDPGEEMTSIG